MSSKKNTPNKSEHRHVYPLEIRIESVSKQTISNSSKYHFRDHYRDVGLRNIRRDNNCDKSYKRHVDRSNKHDSYWKRRN